MREPAMTRRHFELIANVIDALDLRGFQHPEGQDMAELRLAVAHDFSRVFEGVNKSFDRKLFIDACTKSDRKRAERQVGKHSALAALYGAEEFRGKLTKRAAAASDENSDWHPPGLGEDSYNNG